MPEPPSWHGISIRDHITPLRGRLFRIVESQEQVATLGIVDSLAEQARLEALLERSKPPVRPGSAGIHYLLMTPFRYPPLRHGSRFGGRHEPSIFYGSLGADPALAEAAYYRLVFWAGMATAPERPIRSEHTLYQTTYATDCGLQLQCPPFASEQATLTHPAEYRETQSLGATLRAAGVLAFEFTSARDPDRGTHIGLFEPSALASKTVENPQQWLCELDADGARFLSLSDHRIKDYPRDTFLFEGRLPIPAL